MDEAGKVLERLERIQELKHGRAPAELLLEELRELVAEAEEWARVEGDERAHAAVDGLAASVSRADVPQTPTAAGIG
jgi:hypothetical protein